MKCKLCNSDTKLCNSHIIPEFAYKKLYDSKHRFSAVTISEKSPLTRDIKQKGDREKLFCKECEAKFSKYEGYTKKLFKGGIEFGIVHHSEGYNIDSIEYRLFKLFMLSIIYRAGVSSIHMFSRVKLGPHEAIIKNMLVNEDPGIETDYPCVLIRMTEEDKLAQTLIDQPDKMKLSGNTIYKFIFLGHMWVFYVTSHFPKSLPKHYILSESGTITIPTIPLSKLIDLGFMLNKIQSSQSN